MWWVAPGRCRALLLLACTLLARSVGADDLPVIPWQSAAAYVGERVTMEGDVARAEVSNGALVMSFSPDDPQAARVLLVIPLFSDLPRKPESLYLGKRIRATGTLKRLGAGAPEMILRTPDLIEVVNVAGGPAAETTTTTTSPPTTLPATTPTTTLAPRAAEAPVPVAPPPAPAPAPTPTATPTAATAPVAAPVPAGAPAPAAVAPAPPTPAPVPATAPPTPAAPAASAAAAAVAEDDDVEAPTIELPTRDLCTPARARWQEAAARLRERLQALDRCLAAGEPRCREAAAAVAPAMTDLEWAEQHVADLCP